MKKIIFTIYIIYSISTEGLTQTYNNTLAESNSNKEHIKWDLNKILWSHVHQDIKNPDKKLLDFDAMDKWPSMGLDIFLSADGRYFAYTTARGDHSMNRLLDSMIIQSIDTKWRQSFALNTSLKNFESSDGHVTRYGFFSQDGKQFVFQDGRNLYFIYMGASQFKIIPNVVSYKISSVRDSEYIAYLMDDNTMILLNFFSGEETIFKNISEYSFDKTGGWFVCQDKSTNRQLFLFNLLQKKATNFSAILSYSFAPFSNAIILNKGNELSHYEFTKGKYTIIWSANGAQTVNSIAWDNKGSQVAIVVKNDGSVSNRILAGNSVWYWNTAMDKATFKLDNQTIRISQSTEIQNKVSFTEDDENLLISFKKKEPLNESHGAVMVRIWDYKDSALQSNPTRNKYTALLNIQNEKLQVFDDMKEQLSVVYNDMAIIVQKAANIFGGRFWEKDAAYDSCWLLSLKNNSRKFLFRQKGLTTWLSPGKNLMVYFDTDKGGQYYCVNFNNGQVKLISGGVRNNTFSMTNFYSIPKTKIGRPARNGIVKWLKNDEAVFVYDDYDMWQLDISGKMPAMNITNGGKIKRCYTLFDFEEADKMKYISPGDKMLFSIFNTQNKENGLAYKINGTSGNPVILHNGSFFTHDNEINGRFNNIENPGMIPIKAKDNNSWLLQIQTNTQAPNYFSTTDFRAFNQQTFLNPIENYNWYNKELCHFKHLNGFIGQGLLYKPANFDPTKRYPVVVIFYDHFSDRLHLFQDPEYSHNGINLGNSPAWLVNHGYLVFTPDIYESQLKNEVTVFGVLEGAAKFLSGLPYVDKFSIGAGAHSASGKFGTYLFTHSKLYRAISISEGFIYANPINVALSRYNEVRPGSDQLNTLKEVEQMFKFGSLWKNKINWLDQTAVLQADKARMPLLLFCNSKSSKEYQDQTYQLYAALWRLEKKAWWLQYDKGSHNLSDPDEMKDYTIRVTQYFDHYLKNAPAPQWMINGLPLKYKGVESRYELAPAGSCGKDCTICKKWNEKYKEDPELFKKPISEWKLN